MRIRWIGHALRAESDIVVDARLSVVEAHKVTAAEHSLIHAVLRLTAAATVHLDHLPLAGHDTHQVLAHHVDRSVSVVSGG